MSLVPTAICELGLPAVLKYVYPDKDPAIIDKIAAEWKREENYQMLLFFEKRYKYYSGE